MSDNRNRSIILLSGGLDSVVSLTCAREETEVMLALTFDYGQRAAAREIEAGHTCCRHFGIPRRIIPLDWLAEITRTALVDVSTDIPRLREEDLSNADQKLTETMKAVWVPNRNGLFIHIAAAFAETIGAGNIVTGFNREEGRTFPDNSSDFVEAINRGLVFSTLEMVQVVSYTQHLEKPDIVRLGVDKDAPLDSIYSCYVGDSRMCGQCESCVRVKRAFRIAGQEQIVRDRFRE